MTRIARLQRNQETEADFATWVLDLARWSGWTVAHFRPARTVDGWKTPVQADAAGFPDLVLTKPPRLIFAELKAAQGRTTLHQQHWLALLSACPGVEVAVWRPSQREQIERTLTNAPVQT